MSPSNYLAAIHWALGDGLSAQLSPNAKSPAKCLNTFFTQSKPKIPFSTDLLFLAVVIKGFYIHFSLFCRVRDFFPRGSSLFIVP